MSEVDRLIGLVDAFHITDRGLLRARERAVESRDGAATAAFVEAARRYFASMERDAARQLEAIDQRLDDLYQRQYNLQAERGVTQRRREAAREVLHSIETVDMRRPLQR